MLFMSFFLPNAKCSKAVEQEAPIVPPTVGLEVGRRSYKARKLRLKEKRKGPATVRTELRVFHFTHLVVLAWGQ